MKNLLKDVASLLLIVLGLMAFMLVVLSPIALLDHVVERHKCNRLHANTGIETRYTIWNGCLVMHDGNLIPVERWLYVTGEAGN